LKLSFEKLVNVQRQHRRHRDQTMSVDTDQEIRIAESSSCSPPPAPSSPLPPSSPLSASGSPPAADYSDTEQAVTAVTAAGGARKRKPLKTHQIQVFLLLVIPQL
jgi:hypothetical protein